MSAFARYTETVRVPHVARLLALGAIGRLPPAMELVAMVLFIRDRTGSYALAGSVTAGYTIGFATGSPFLGRMIDRHGPTRVLWPAALMHFAAMVALVLAGLADQPGFLLILLGLASGAATPPTGSLVRRVLGQLVSDRRALLPSVFALDSLVVELVFIGGPLLTAVIIVVASPAAALITSGLITIVAVAGLAVMPAIVREASEERQAGSGALRSAGMWTVIGCIAPVGAAYGVFQVSVVAFADHVDASSSAAWLLALLSVGGVLGAFAYGAYGHRVKGSTALIIGTCALPACFALILLATSVVQMAPFVILAGAMLTPVFAITTQIVGDVAPPGAVTEAYSWLFMASLSGGAIGLALCGSLVQSNGWRAGIVLAVAVTAISAVVAVTRRGTLPDIGWDQAGVEAS